MPRCFALLTAQQPIQNDAQNGSRLLAVDLFDDRVRSTTLLVL